MLSFRVTVCQSQRKNKSKTQQGLLVRTVSVSRNEHNKMIGCCYNTALSQILNKDDLLSDLFIGCLHALFTYENELQLDGKLELSP